MPTLRFVVTASVCFGAYVSVGSGVVASSAGDSGGLRPKAARRSRGAGRLSGGRSVRGTAVEVGSKLGAVELNWRVCACWAPEANGLRLGRPPTVPDASGAAVGSPSLASLVCSALSTLPLSLAGGGPPTGGVDMDMIDTLADVSVGASSHSS